jgi:hypothetical protein
MDGILWFSKYKNNQVTKDFIKMFGGMFQIDPDGNNLYWESDYNKPYDTPIDEVIFWDMIIQSIKQKKNLLIR